MRRVLVLDPAYSQALSVSRALREAGSTVYGGVIEGALPARYRGGYDRIVRVGTDCRLEDYDQVVPTSSGSMEYLWDQLGDITLGSIHSPQSNREIGQKADFLELAARHGVPVPRTYPRYEDIPESSGEVFYKPAVEGYYGAREWAASKAAVPARYRGGEYIFQDYVNSPGTYGFGFLAEDGVVLAECQHFEALSYPPRGGSAAVITGSEVERVSELSHGLLQAIGYSGWGLLEFKYCPARHDYLLMELNPKLWASIEFSLREEPKFSKQLLGLEVARRPCAGLVWPDRLLSSGLVAGIAALLKYRHLEKVWEPGIGRAFIKGMIPGALRP